MELLYCAIYIAVLGITSNIIGNALPRRWFCAERFPFRCFDWEDEGRIYLKFHIRAWKDRVPDMSKYVKYMYRKKVESKPSADNFTRLIEESCVAEAGHVVLILASLVVVRIWRGTWGWVIWLLCALGNLPFIMIQRFNRPRLQQALRHFRLKADQAVYEGTLI